MAEKEIKDFEYNFWNSKLDEEEQQYENNFDNFVPSKNQKEIRKTLQESAKNTLKEISQKNKKMVTMRLNSADVTKLKQIADTQGLQYQSLVNSIIHRYLNGTLVDITEAKKILAL